MDNGALPVSAVYNVAYSLIGRFGLIRLVGSNAKDISCQQSRRRPGG